MCVCVCVCVCEPHSPYNISLITLPTSAVLPITISLVRFFKFLPESILIIYIFLEKQSVNADFHKFGPGVVPGSISVILKNLLCISGYILLFAIALISFCFLCE